MQTRHVWIAALAALSMSACSSRPRQFSPTLAATPEDSAKFAADFQSCRVMVAQGQRSGFGSRVASGGVGVAAGTGAAVAVAGGASSSMVGAMAAASAAAVLMPVVGVLGAWGMAKVQKNKKEEELKTALDLCLTELGYSVAEWKPDKSLKRVKIEKLPRT